MAVQLAVDRGATVVATAAPCTTTSCAGWAPIPVEYGLGLMDRVRDVAPDGVNAALDLAGSDEALDVSFVLVPDRTRIATIASFERGLATGIQVLGGAPGPTRAPRSAPRPGWTWPGWPRRGSSGCSCPRPSRWPGRRRRTGSSWKATPRARSRSSRS